MSKQWGHGYYQGIETALKGPLVGKFFHSYKDGETHWQGRVLQPLPGDRFLVQLYEWVMGQESDQFVVSLEQMLTWHFYDSAKQMREAHEKEEFIADEKFRKEINAPWRGRT